MCEHKETRYEPSINENGWECMDCHQKLGFRPDLDRRDTHWKTLAILNVLHDNHIIHISNASEGEAIIWGMKKHCEKANRYDQKFITMAIIKMEDFGEGKYWREQAKKWQPPKQAPLSSPSLKAGVSRFPEVQTNDYKTNTRATRQDTAAHSPR